MSAVDGHGANLGSLARLSSAVSRSISAENPTGGSGRGDRAAEGTGQAAARDLGPGWKVSPAVGIEPQETRLLANIEGPGAVQHVWMGLNGTPELAILRFFWDGRDVPSIECPMGHFFACGWGGVEPVSSLPVCMNARNGFNCFWEMPFRTSCRITVENTGREPMVLYYQIDYALAPIAEDAGCFHARFQRSAPSGICAVHTVLDNATGPGHYVGTYLAWGAAAMIGTDEELIAFFRDQNGEETAVQRSRIEDYFGMTAGQEFSTPYAGLVRASIPEGPDIPRRHLGLYRWHVMDPIRFRHNLRVVIAGLSGRTEDLSSVAYWYQRSPTAPLSAPAGG